MNGGDVMREGWDDLKGDGVGGCIDGWTSN